MGYYFATFFVLNWYIKCIHIFHHFTIMRFPMYVKSFRLDDNDQFCCIFSPLPLGSGMFESIDLGLPMFMDNQSRDSCQPHMTVVTVWSLLQNYMNMIDNWGGQNRGNVWLYVPHTEELFLKICPFAQCQSRSSRNILDAIEPWFRMWLKSLVCHETIRYYVESPITLCVWSMFGNHMWNDRGFSALSEFDGVIQQQK